MESRFQHDFSRVRVHTDAPAAQSAAAVQAAAYTVGHDVVFGMGRYAPGRPEGRRLVAHELAHVLQQEGMPSATGTLRIGPAGDRLEREADDAADRIDTNGPLPNGARAGIPVLQRQNEKTPKPLIPIPVFDELDPTVIAPDIPGVPDFLRGQELKLSDLRKALGALSGSTSPSAGPDFCARFGMEEASSGQVKGQCCPKFVRDEAKCCGPKNMDLFQARCCTPEEINVQGRCLKPRSATGPKPAPQQERAPGPAPAPVPTPAAPQPVPSVIFFGLERPQAGAKGEEALRKSLVPDSVKTFDQLFQQLKDNPSFKVQLTGKSSSDGLPEFNRELGERRVRLVAEVLTAKGLERSRIAEPPAAGPGCALVEDGIRNCGETGAATKPDPADRQVQAHVFAVAAAPAKTGAVAKPPQTLGEFAAVMKSRFKVQTVRAGTFQDQSMGDLKESDWKPWKEPDPQIYEWILRSFETVEAELGGVPPVQEIILYDMHYELQHGKAVRDPETGASFALGHMNIYASVVEGGEMARQKGEPNKKLSTEQNAVQNITHELGHGMAEISLPQAGDDPGPSLDPKLFKEYNRAVGWIDGSASPKLFDIQRPEVERAFKNGKEPSELDRINKANWDKGSWNGQKGAVDPWKERPLTSYMTESPGEDFAEAFRAFIHEPALLEALSPARFKFLQKRKPLWIEHFKKVKGKKP